MKAPQFKKLDYVSFPVEKDGKERRTGFIYRIRSKQLDICAARDPKANEYSKFGIHRKYIEKDRLAEISHVALDKDITKWPLCTVVLWSMVRLYMTDGDFVSDHIKPILNDESLQEKHKKVLLIEKVRGYTIRSDRRTAQYDKLKKQMQSKKKKKASGKFAAEFKLSSNYAEYSSWSDSNSS